MKEINMPKPTGEYAVGTFTYTVKDDREEVMAPGTMRSVASRVYYPVSKESVEGLQKTVALSDNMIKGFKDAYKVAPNFKKNPEMNHTECYTDAPRIPGEKFPLIMFNHGFNSYREGNSFLCIDLASHGYVVISVAHSMEGVCTEFDDGSVIFFDKSITKKQYQPMLGGVITMLKLMKARGTDEELAERFDEAQNKYCKSYEDFKADQWTEIDTVYLDGHSKSHQLWMGGNDYKLTTGDKAQDEIIKKEAFAVICKDTIYVNCRNLRFENTGFGNGYTKGYRYDGDKLCIVNKIIGKAVANKILEIFAVE